MNNFNAQEWIEKNLVDKNIKEASFSSETIGEVNWTQGILPVGGKLSGDLIIQDFPELERIGLSGHELTSLTIKNCPKLKYVGIRNNQLTKLEFNQTPEIKQIIAGKNELTSLDLTNCSKLKELIIPDNTLLSELKHLNLSEIKNLNIDNTMVNLASDYEQLKAENENLLEIVKNTKEGVEEGAWILTKTIQNSIQADEAIQQLLQKVEREWREYFAHPTPKSILHLSFQDPKLRKRGKEILLQVIQTQRSRDYTGLVKEWNAGQEYNAEHDFDGESLNKLIKLSKAHDYLKKEESLPVEA